jgi:type I restriction enzyme M protein
MTGSQQRAALQRQIWQIANDVRSAVDGWDFEQYVLGTLFYRFISENFSRYIEVGDESVCHARMPDSVISPEIKNDAIKTKGYVIYPSQLFANISKDANTNECLNTELAAIFGAIEVSTNGYPSERDIKCLFADVDTTSNRPGNTVKAKNARLASVLKGVAGLDISDFQRSQIDLFDDADEFLISNDVANASNSGVEFFTPTRVKESGLLLDSLGNRTNQGSLTPLIFTRKVKVPTSRASDSSCYILDPTNPTHCDSFDNPSRE